MLELYNQLSIYIGTKEFKSNFWDIQPMIRSLQPNWKRWQKAWRNRIKYYTPRTDPPKEDVELRGMIEKWNPKKKLGEPQTTTIKMSPMFGEEVVAMYKQCNESYNPTPAIKSMEAAESLRKLVALDIKFMVGCDEEWNFDDAADADAAAAPGPLAPGGEGDDAGASPPPPAGGGAAPNDPYDFTKWDLTDLPSIPLGELLSEENNTASRRSWHAALILIFLSDDIERLHPDVAKKLHAVYNERFERPVEAQDLKRYPSIGPGAYNVEEVRWCDATYDFLVSQLDDEGRVKRGIPRRTRRSPAGRPQAAQAAPAAAPAQAPAADQNLDTEDDDTQPLRRQRNPKRRRSAR